MQGHIGSSCTEVAQQLSSEGKRLIIMCRNVEKLVICMKNKYSVRCIFEWLYSSLVEFSVQRTSYVTILSEQVGACPCLKNE